MDIFLGEGAEEIIGVDGKVTGLRTANRTIDADLVVLATGMVANSGINTEYNNIVAAEIVALPALSMSSMVSSALNRK